MVDRRHLAVVLGAALVGCSSEPPYQLKHASNPGVRTAVPTQIVWENHMGDGFRLQSIAVKVDGQPVYTKTRGSDDGTDGLDQKELLVWTGNADDEPHVVRADVVYKGHGSGVFVYLKGYEFKVAGEHTSFPKGPSLDVRIVGYEKGGPTTAIEERPAIRFIDRVGGEGR